MAKKAGWRGTLGGLLARRHSSELLDAEPPATTPEDALPDGPRMPERIARTWRRWPIPDPLTDREGHQDIRDRLLNTTASPEIIEGAGGRFRAIPIDSWWN